MMLPIGVNNSKGFTLIEIMISVVILGAGLTLVANSYIVAARGMNVSANHIQALELAKEKLAELESTSLKEGLISSFTQGVIESPLKNYDYSIDITDLTSPQELIKTFVQVCLTLSWKEQNTTKNVTLSTYLAKQQKKEKT